MTKTQTPHVVPLSRQAIAILETLHPVTAQSEYVFPNLRSQRRPMSDNAILSALRRMDINKSEMSGQFLKIPALVKPNACAIPIGAVAEVPFSSVGAIIFRNVACCCWLQSSFWEQMAGNVSSVIGYRLYAVGVKMLSTLICLCILSLWASGAASSRLGDGLLGYASYGGSSRAEPPALQLVSQVDAGLEVTFNPPGDSGGYPVTGYQYSLDGTTWFDVPAGVTVFLVPSALVTPGATNTVYLRSVSAAGTSESNATADVDVDPNTYAVTPSAGDGGAISPSTVQTIAEGSTTTFTVTPDGGYGIASVGGTCGGSLSGNTYTTNAITAACNVVATFALLDQAVPVPVMPLWLLLLGVLILVMLPKYKRLL